MVRWRSIIFSCWRLPCFSTFVGILNKDGTIDNAKSIKRLAEISVVYAKAGEYRNAWANVAWIVGCSTHSFAHTLTITHSPTHSLSHLLIHSLTHSFTYSLTHSLIPHIHQFTQPPTHQLTYMYISISYNSDKHLNYWSLLLTNPLSGYDVIAPSDMMDNRVSAIKQALAREQLGNKVSNWCVRYRQPLWAEL